LKNGLDEMISPKRPTFALPHLGAASDNDSAARKRQYRVDLQDQMNDNQRRKAQDWRVPRLLTI
jgi:hypothetical protein